MAVPEPAHLVIEEIPVSPKAEPMPRRSVLRSSAVALATFLVMNLIPELGGVETAYAGVKYCNGYCCNCSSVTTRCFAFWGLCGTARVVVDFVVNCSGSGCAPGWYKCATVCTGPFRCCSYTCSGCPLCCHHCPH
jgi:hypothetical protein